ncbi:tetratricopeptide repeat protein [Microcoleus sp. FACHB-831]|uniref:tetratricopeptide repeat protein n=1 Tax=Microcoleus sp. FACHB-831 TaxID=2692827 RepID=UPI00168229EA|nr:tetratricopeptide repeat protein [Microcoleus sp. FACHB-831]MBD1923394.1 tetratricopeptide repeat protein [Microcoleus sp. FACHB-831]
MKLNSKVFPYITPFIYVVFGMSPLLLIQPNFAINLEECLIRGNSQSDVAERFIGSKPLDDVERRECEELGKQQPEKPEPQQKDLSERSRLLDEANNLYNAEDFAGAESIFRNLVALYRNDDLIHYKLGNALYRQNKIAAAVREYQQTIRLNSKSAVAYNAIGIIRLKQGKFNEAVASFRKALEIDVNYAEAHQNLGQALWQQGKKEEAIASLEKARNLLTQKSTISPPNQGDLQLLQCCSSPNK